MPLSDWLIGAKADIPETTITVVQGATSEDVTLAAGSYYLWDPVSTRSLVDSIAAAINTHSLISDCAATLQQDRLVSFAATPTFTATFANTTAREMAGFTANMTPASASHTANAISKWLWVPLRRMISDAMYQTTGNPVFDTARAQSAKGNTSSTRHNSLRVNEFTWRYIPRERLHTTSESGGELFAFFEEVISRDENFKVYLATENDEASSSDASLSGPLGPYVHNTDSGDVEFNWQRELKAVDRLGFYQLPVVTTQEFS